MATGQQVVDLTREIMDATGSGQWTDAVLQTWCGQAHWQLWANLLNANRYLKMQQVTVTQDANGQFARSDLSTGFDESKKYFYRILTVAQCGSSSAFYRKSSYEEYPTSQFGSFQPYVWYRFGDVFQVRPVAAGQSVVVTVNYRPPNPAQLDLSSDIDFPEGYEALISWRAAQLALVKGGSETQAARDIKVTAESMEAAMLQDLGRDSKWPIVAESFDDASDWAG